MSFFYQKKCPNCNLCVLELRTGPVVVAGVGTGIFFDVDPRGGVGPSGSPGGGYPISEGFFLFSVRSAEKVWTPERMKISPGPPPSPGGYPCVGGDHLPLALKKSLLRMPALHQTAGPTELSQEADSLTTLRGIFWMAPASEDLGQRGARRGAGVAGPNSAAEGPVVHSLNFRIQNLAWQWSGDVWCGLRACESFCNAPFPPFLFAGV